MIDRKIIQIAVIKSEGAHVVGVYAVCDDGTLWRTTSGVTLSDEWVQLPKIPPAKDWHDTEDDKTPEAEA